MAVCVLIKNPTCKFLQNQEHRPMGFLTRPVTGYEACYGAGHNKYTDDYEGSLYHMSVPLILPSMSDTAIAVMNTPASM